MITEAEDSLFQRWATGRIGFVRDGIVDEPAYRAATPSILFLLKEVNDKKGGGWDLRKFIRNGARKSTWNNVTRWVRGIRALPAEVSWSELGKDFSKEERSATLGSIAVMNLKKSPGGHTAATRVVLDAAHTDKAFLQEQFALYSAELVICCGSGVASAFDDLVELRDVALAGWKTTSRGVRHREFAPRRHVVAYSHPEARVAENLLCYGLVDAVREIRCRVAGSAGR